MHPFSYYTYFISFQLHFSYYEWMHPFVTTCTHWIKLKPGLNAEVFNYLKRKQLYIIEEDIKQQLRIHGW